METVFSDGDGILLANVVEALEDFFLGLRRGVDGEEGELSVFFGDEDRRGSFDVFHEALAVLESDLDVGEGMLRVGAVPFLIVPGLDEFEGLVVTARGDGLEEESETIPTMT